MRIYGYPCLIAFLVFCPVARGDAPSAPDAFLDRPLPDGFLPHISDRVIFAKEANISGETLRFAHNFLQYTSYQERLDALKRLSPRRLFLPEGFADFIAKGDECSNRKRGDLLFPGESTGVAGIGTTYRAFMTQSFLMMALDCKYDPSTDALATDFTWHHDDTRSNYDLLQSLKTTRPTAEDSTHRNSSDPWRTAFDALLSKPGNFSSVWKLRFLDDVQDETFFFGAQSGTILWSGELPDEKMQKHFLIINYHSMMMPTGRFCCYVFNAEGRFEYGALLNGAYRCSGAPHVDLQPRGDGLTIYYNEHTRPACGYLYLEREGVMLHDSDVRNGSCLGIPLYRTETILN